MAKKRDFEDDGRTIANMNVEGMPWYSPERGDAPKEPQEQIDLSPAERRAMMGGILKATLLVTGAFGLGITIFLLLLDLVLLK